MYYYKVKENSVIENMMTEDKEAIDGISKRTSSFCEKYGFKAATLITYPVIFVDAVIRPNDDADLDLFKKISDYGDYIPRKRYKSVYDEFQAIGNHKKKLNDFIYSNSNNNINGQRRLTWEYNEKPFMIGYSHKLNQDIIDENLIEITKSEFMKRKEEE